LVKRRVSEYDKRIKAETPSSFEYRIDSKQRRLLENYSPLREKKLFSVINPASVCSKRSNDSFIFNKKDGLHDFFLWKNTPIPQTTLSKFQNRTKDINERTPAFSFNPIEQHNLLNTYKRATPNKKIKIINSKNTVCSISHESSSSLRTNSSDVIKELSKNESNLNKDRVSRCSVEPPIKPRNLTSKFHKLETSLKKRASNIKNNSFWPSKQSQNRFLSFFSGKKKDDSIMKPTVNEYLSSDELKNSSPEIYRKNISEPTNSGSTMTTQISKLRNSNHIEGNRSRKAKSCVTSFKHLSPNSTQFEGQNISNKRSISLDIEKAIKRGLDLDLYHKIYSKPEGENISDNSNIQMNEIINKSSDSLIESDDDSSKNSIKSKIYKHGCWDAIKSLSNLKCFKNRFKRKATNSITNFLE
jgi:hypothetical protein